MLHLQPGQEMCIRDSSVNVVAWKKIGGAKVGGGAGYTFTKSHSKMNGTGTEHSGSVNSPKADGYGFSWDFVMWNMTLNGKKVPAPVSYTHLTR